MKMFLALAILFSLLGAGSASARKMGLPLVRPLPGNRAFVPAAYAASLRGEASDVQMNCTAADHAAAYQMNLRDATLANLPLLMENLQVKPLPPDAHVRVVGLDANTCQPFYYERAVREGEEGLWSTNLQAFIGSASCGNPLEVLVRDVLPPPRREFAQRGGNTPWISETGDGLDWGSAFRNCPNDSDCGQWHQDGRAAMYSVAAVLGAMALPEAKTVQNITTKVVNRSSGGVPANPAPIPPGGGPAQPAPVPPGRGGDGLPAQPGGAH